MSDEKPPPDFAMLRAVEVLAQLVEKMRSQPNVPPPPIDRPVILFNEECPIQIGVTTRQTVERAFGTGFTYPAKGWHTYGMRRDGAQAMLSLFYRDDVLIAAEHYFSTAKDAPPLAPRSYGAFRFVPGEVGLGTSFTKLSELYVPAVGGPGAIVFDSAYEARFEGGVAYVMGNKGLIERLVLYVDVPR